MCLAGQPPAPPAAATAAADAAAMARAALGWLAAADVASLTTAELADCLRALERVRSVLTAGQARVLAAFHAQNGYADDGHGSPRAHRGVRPQPPHPADRPAGGPVADAGPPAESGAGGPGRPATARTAGSRRPGAGRPRTPCGRS